MSEQLPAPTETNPANAGELTRDQLIESIPRRMEIAQRAKEAADKIAEILDTDDTPLVVSINKSEQGADHTAIISKYNGSSYMIKIAFKNGDEDLGGYVYNHSSASHDQPFPYHVVKLTRDGALTSDADNVKSLILTLGAGRSIAGDALVDGSEPSDNGSEEFITVANALVLAREQYYPEELNAA